MRKAKLHPDLVRYRKKNSQGDAASLWLFKKGIEWP
jgi:hypothetical protein